MPNNHHNLNEQSLAKERKEKLLYTRRRRLFNLRYFSSFLPSSSNRLTFFVLNFVKKPTYQITTSHNAYCKLYISFFINEHPTKKVYKVVSVCFLIVYFFPHSLFAAGIMPTLLIFNTIRQDTQKSTSTNN